MVKRTLAVAVYLCVMLGAVQDEQPASPLPDVVEQYVSIAADAHAAESKSMPRELAAIKREYILVTRAKPYKAAISVDSPSLPKLRKEQHRSGIHSPQRWVVSNGDMAIRHLRVVCLPGYEDEVTERLEIE